MELKIVFFVYLFHKFLEVKLGESNLVDHAKIFYISRALYNSKLSAFFR